ncbi:MAG: PQQ-binding-like beta-propeller repeat protein, partial [Planctomycetota bacterium]
LFCLDRQTGNSKWMKNIQTDYQSPPGYFGSGSTPILVENRLILNVGGKDAAVVAFDPANGREIWKSFDDRASYSSPIEFKLNGQNKIALISRFHFLIMDPKSGEVEFKTEFGVRGPSVNGAMPVFVSGGLFVNSAYGVGARFLTFANGRWTEEWNNDRSFSSQFSTPVHKLGYLFGTAGREDFGNGSLRCIDPKTGKVTWEKDFPVGHCILVENKILFLDSTGKLHIVSADSEKFEELASFQILDGPSRSMPAIQDGIFYARSNSRGRAGELKAVRVGMESR